MTDGLIRQLVDGFRARSYTRPGDLEEGEEMAEFRVDLDGLELSDEQARRISSGVQRVVLAELADVDLKGDAFALIRDPEWLGIWLRQLRAEHLAQLDPGITERFGRKF